MRTLIAVALMVISASAISAESKAYKPIDLKTKDGCNYVLFVSADKSPIEVQKRSVATWDGACVNGYLEGIGNFKYTDTVDDYSFSQRVPYKNGRENGYGTETRVTDKQKIEFEGEFRDGRWYKGSKTVNFFRSGQKQVTVGYFVDGRQQGDGEVTFYENGSAKLRIVGNFVDGMMEGAATVTSIDQKMSWQGPFTHSKKNGVGLQTRADGTTDWVAYENDVIPDVGVGDGTAAHYMCAERGLRPGTSYYARCRSYIASKEAEKKALAEFIQQSNDSMREAQEAVERIESRRRQ